MKIRNFALTLITAAIAAAGLIFKEDVRVQIHGVDFPLASAIIFGAIPIWVGFYLMDRYWYHNFLIGAVKHGHFIEHRLGSVLPELGLANAISKESPTKICKIKIHSSTKIHLFYWLGIIVLLIPSLLMALFARNIPNNKDSQIHKSIKLDETLNKTQEAWLTENDGRLLFPNP